MKHLLLALLFVATGGARATDVAAQAARPDVPSGAIFRGQVVDSVSGDPVPGVMIRMDSGAEAFSDAHGEFRFTGLPQGRRTYALLSADCRITWGQIDVIVGIPRQERLRLPPAFGAASEAAKEEEEGRKRMGGRRIEAEDIQRSNARSVTEVIRRYAPQMVSNMDGELGAESTLTSGRTRSFVDQDPPVVVINGLRIPNPDVVLADMLPSEVDLIEILPGSVAGWEYGSAGAAGVIKITLRRGIEDGAPVRREVSACVVPEFPGRGP